MGGELDYRFVAVSARHDGVNPSFEVERHVLDGFALAQPHSKVIEIDARCAHLSRAEVKGDASSKAWLFKNQANTAADERFAEIQRARLYFLRGRKDPLNFRGGEVTYRNQVFERQSHSSQESRAICSLWSPIQENQDSS